MTTAETSLLIERRGSLLLLTLDRPSRANAFDGAIADAFERALDGLDADVTALVVTGSGDSAFCAGADIAELAGLDEPTARARMRRVQDLFRRLELLPVPVIAAVNGYALGGGLELAMACDLRVAGVSARFGQPEIRLANIPGWGGTQRLPRLVGVGRANEMIFTGDHVSAHRAYEIGLVNRVVADGTVVEAAVELADRLATMSPIALGWAKRAIHTGLDGGITEGQRVEADGVAVCCQTEQQHEAVAVFLSRRS